MSLYKQYKDLKLVIVGSSGVGKSSFLNRWIKGVFNNEIKPTIVSDFYHKFYNYNGKIYKVQIWDLAGQDKNIVTSKIFARDAQGCIVMSDITNPDFNSVIKWKKAINDYVKFIDKKDIPFILVQNKLDLVNESEQNDDENLKSFLDNEGFVNSFKASAKEGINVNECIDYLIQTIDYRLNEYYLNNNTTADFDDKRTSIVLQNKQAEGNMFNKKGFCCIKL